ncbi:uncharacterized protein [Diabrotica undecimpunctata]|uniref:uncharacterized protein n=1 Tax=Diabrotica undecimpunctata TaxID=50387 RepID=UPI003B63680F
MSDCKISDIPMQPKLNLSICKDKNLVGNVKLPYRELIGCLMYLMLGSRPDLSFCMSYFSQFQNNYTEEHWKNLKNVLRYLKSTENYVISFVKGRNKEIEIVSYVDADFANNQTDRKSISGYVIKFNKNVICWKTKKQNVVSLSSAEAEYMALSSCVAESLFFSQMLEEIFKIMYSVHVYEDNKSYIKMASTLESKRTKHIDVRHHFIRDCLEKELITLQYVQSDQQQADIFTKSLSKSKFTYFRELLNVTEL